MDKNQTVQGPQPDKNGKSGGVGFNPIMAYGAAAGLFCIILSLPAVLAMPGFPDGHLTALEQARKPIRSLFLLIMTSGAVLYPVSGLFMAWKKPSAGWSGVFRAFCLAPLVPALLYYGMLPFILKNLLGLDSGQGG